MTPFPFMMREVAVTREDFRMHASLRRGGNDDLLFLRHLELAKICPEFPLDSGQGIRIPLARPRATWVRGIFARRSGASRRANGR
jgi:hypothetical protein